MTDRLSRRASRGLEQGASTEVELNITPIIDCFTVLITFLLASACFLNVGFFETETPGATTPVEGGAPATELIARALGNHRVELQFKGARRERLRFDLEKPRDRELLEQEVSRFSTSGKNARQLLVTALPAASYEALAELMDSIASAKLPLVIGDFE